MAALHSKPYEASAITAKTEYVVPEKKECDGRVRVTDASRYPYCSIGYFDADFRGKKPEGHGTGFLVGPQHFLVAAHSLFRRDEVKEDEQWSTECRVFCGLNGYQQYLDDDKDKEYIAAARLFVPRAFIENHDANYDFALILLTKPVGCLRGWLGCLYTSSDSFLKEEYPLTITGYPNDLPKEEDPQYGASVRGCSLWTETGTPREGTGRYGIRFTVTKFFQLMNKIDETGTILALVDTIIHFTSPEERFVWNLLSKRQETSEETLEEFKQFLIRRKRKLLKLLE